MPKIRIIRGSSSRELEAEVNNWINSHWHNISEVYDVRVQRLDYPDGWIAVITYEVAHGK